jgi:chromosome segregation ATPase
VELSPVVLGAFLSSIVSIPLTIIALRRFPLERTKMRVDTDKAAGEALAQNFAALTNLHDQLEAALADRTEMKRKLLQQEDTLIGMQSQIKTMQAEIGLLKDQRMVDSEVIKAERLIRQRVEAELSASRETAVSYEIRLTALEDEVTVLEDENARLKKEAV